MKNYILKDENAVLFECGYSCDNVYFASLNGEKFFITDGRYGVEARAKIAEYCLQNELNFCANLDEKSNFNQTVSNIHVVILIRANLAIMSLKKSAHFWA